MSKHRDIHKFDAKDWWYARHTPGNELKPVWNHGSISEINWKYFGFKDRTNLGIYISVLFQHSNIIYELEMSHSCQTSVHLKEENCRQKYWFNITSNETHFYTMLTLNCCQLWKSARTKYSNIPILGTLFFPLTLGFGPSAKAVLCLFVWCLQLAIFFSWLILVQASPGMWGKSGWSNVSSCAFSNSFLTLCRSHSPHKTTPQSHASLVCVCWSYHCRWTCSHIHCRGILTHWDHASARAYKEKYVCCPRIHIDHIESSSH